MNLLRTYLSFSIIVKIGQNRQALKQVEYFLLVNKGHIYYNDKSVMGLSVLLVHAEVFKTFWEARAVSAGFDSQSVPPFLTYQGIGSFPSLGSKPRFNPSSQSVYRMGAFPIRYRLRHQILHNMFRRASGGTVSKNCR